jgi:hypothetical protein
MTRPVRREREWAAYFPAAILMVDRPELVDVFAASGVLVQARMAVVCVDGTPRPVMRWLIGGLGRGWRAPIGYLHDSATILYPFVLEPLRSCLDVLRPDESLVFRDLGLPREGLDPGELPFATRLRRRIHRLSEPPPAAMIAWATRQLMATVPRDPWLEPLRPREKRRLSSHQQRRAR